MKRMLICGLCVLLLSGVVCLPAAAADSQSLETERECSLSVYYAHDGVGFQDLEILLYRVAEAQADGSFCLISPYSEFPVSIYDVTSQQEWKTVAGTLACYVVDAQIPADRTVRTDGQGKAQFQALETGLYLVLGVKAEKDMGIYQFDDFLMYLPNYMDGMYHYDVETKPKCGRVIPVTEYQVTKLWKDASNGSERPAEVTVEIMKDGVLQYTQVLNQENQWTFTWKVTDDRGRWTVTEKNVPEGYTVTVSQKDRVFVITNTAQTTEEPPETGDTFPMWPYLLTMCISGLLLLALGIRRGRSR